MSFNDKPALCKVNLNFKEEPGDGSFFNVLIKLFRKMTFGTNTLFQYRKQDINSTKHPVAERMFRAFHSTHLPLKPKYHFLF